MRPPVIVSTVLVLIVVVFLMTSSATWADALQTANLVANPSFEEVDEAGQPAGWSVPAGRVVSLDSTTAYDGNRCIHLSLDGEVTRFTQSASFRIVPDGYYVLSAMVKTRGFQSQSPYGILLVNDGWSWASPPLEIRSSDSDWREYRIRFRVPALEGMSHDVRVNLYWDGDEGDVWVDAVQLVADQKDYRQSAPGLPAPAAGGEAAGTLQVTLEAPPTMTTDQVAIITVRARVRGTVVRDEARGAFVDRIELHKFESDTGGEWFQPRASLGVVRNPDKEAREFVARFMVTSPEPGTQYYGVWAGYRPQWTVFSIQVAPKTCRIGEEIVLDLAAALPSAQDSTNYLPGLVVHRCKTQAKFGLDEESGVRMLLNRDELLGNLPSKIAAVTNPVPTAELFKTSVPIGTETEPGLHYYVVESAYCDGIRLTDIISVQVTQ